MVLIFLYQLLLGRDITSETYVQKGPNNLQVSESVIYKDDEPSTI